MSADPNTRSRAQAWPRVSWPRRAVASALAAGLALLAVLPLGAQPHEKPAAPAAPAPEPAAQPPEKPAEQPAPAEKPAAQPAPAEKPAAQPEKPAAQPEPAEQPAPADAIEPPARPAADTVGNLSTRRSWGWIAVGTAAAFATTSAMLALAVESREADIAFLIDFRAPIVDAPNRYEGQARGRYEELVDEAETLSRAAWITLGLASATALAATALFVLDGGVTADDAPEARSHLTPAVAPGAVPGGMGVTLDWEF